MTPPVTVLAPRARGRAQRVGDRLWRRLILPVGEVTHQGKTLKFSRDYIATVADSFRRYAYDYIPLQLSAGLDPEAYAGRLIDAEAAEDGLWAVIEATERGDALLSASPDIPISAKITEGYARSDGQYFDAALAAVTAGSDVGLANAGPSMYIDLSASHWAGEQLPDDQLTDQELADLLDAVAEADQEAVMDEYVDIDQVIRQSLPLSNYRRDLGLANEFDRFSRVFEFANARESTRLAQDEDSRRPRRGQDRPPPPPTSEERLQAAFARIEAGTFVPAGMYAAPYAREFSVQAGAINGGINCGATDELTGLCIERYHAHSCGSIADTFTAEALRPAMARLAAQPMLDADGRAWTDRQFGSPMTLLDHVESATGQRLGDKSLFESGRARREVAAVARRVKFGDPDAGPEDEAWHPVSAATRRTAQALADASKGLLRTSADVATQQAADKAQHARLATRIGPPRSADYAELSNPAHSPVRPVQFEQGWNGSVPGYTYAGSVAGPDEWLA